MLGLQCLLGRLGYFQAANAPKNEHLPCIPLWEKEVTILGKIDKTKVNVSRDFIILKIRINQFEK